MKTSIKTILFVLMAMLSLSSCLSDNDETQPETTIDYDHGIRQKFFGRWNVKTSDKTVVEDSSVWYTFKEDGAFKEEFYDALSPEGQQNFVAEGTWELKASENKAILIIKKSETNAETGTETSHTDEYNIVKFNGNSFTATIGGTSYDFTKIIYE